MAVAQQQSLYGRFIIASQSGGSAMFADVSFKCTTTVKEFGKKCTRNIPTLHKKEKKKSRHCTDFGFFGEEKCFPRRYVPLVRWRFDSLLGEKPRPASEPLHIPPSSSPFAPNKSFVRLLRLPEFRLQISHTSKKEQLTGAMKERKKERKKIGLERASSREQGRGFSSPHASDPLKLPSCEHSGATAMLSLSLFVYLLT
jgi:hypothetical protein